MSKHKTSVSLSEEALRLLTLLALELGVSKSDVLEFIIREKAKEKGIGQSH